MAGKLAISNSHMTARLHNMYTGAMLRGSGLSETWLVYSSSCVE